MQIIKSKEKIDNLFCLFLNILIYFSITESELQMMPYELNV